MQLLAIKLLLRTLNDICELDECPQTRREQYSKIEKDFDEEWENLNRDFENALQLWKIEKNKAIKEIKKQDNEEKINKKVKKERSAIRARVYRKKQKMEREISQNPRRRKEILAEFESFVKSSEEELRITLDYLRSKINSSRIQAKMAYENLRWQREKEKIFEKFQKLEDFYNKRRTQEDRIRSSIEWCTGDVDKVVEVCKLAGLNVVLFYEKLKERLEMMGRLTPEIEELVENIRNHKF